MGEATNGENNPNIFYLNCSVTIKKYIYKFFYRNYTAPVGCTMSEVTKTLTLQEDDQYIEFNTTYGMDSKIQVQDFFPQVWH